VHLIKKVTSNALSGLHNAGLWACVMCGF